MSVLPYSTKMPLTHSTYKVFKNGFFVLDSSEVRLSFLIKMGALKAGLIEDALLPSLGIKDNAKFSIASVFKYLSCFSP